MQEIADILRSQREARGLTIEDIFDSTRINPEFLEALEAGRFDILPPAYIRLFLKTYARELGLDTEEVLRRYEAIAPKPLSPPPPRPVRTAPVPAIALTLILLSVVAVVIYQINRRESAPPAVPFDASVRHGTNLPARMASPVTEPQKMPASGAADTAATTGMPATATETPQLKPSAEQPAVPTQEKAQPVQPAPTEQEPSTSPVQSAPVASAESTPSADAPVSTTGAAAEKAQQRVAQTVAAEAPKVPPVTSPSGAQPEPQNSAQTLPQETASQDAETEVLSTYELPLPVIVPDGDPMTVSGLVREATRLSVSADGRTVFSGELPAGSQPRWQARDTLRLQVARAGDITLSLQNQALASSSPPNRSLRLLVTRTRIRVEELAPQSAPVSTGH